MGKIYKESLSKSPWESKKKNTDKISNKMDTGNEKLVIGTDKMDIENDTMDMTGNDTIRTGDDSIDKKTVGKKRNQELGVFSKSTLFVSTLPFDTTKEQLEEFFSQVGPIRSCFIIKNKETGKHSGCGYVQFALQEDAEKALIQLKKETFQGKRTLKIVKAVRKSVVGERRDAGIPLDLEDREEREKKNLERVKKQIKVIPKGPGLGVTKKKLQSCTLLLKHVPLVQKNVLYKKVRKYGTVSELIVSGEENDLEPATAKVVYSTPEECQKAHKHLHNHIYKGVTIEAEIVETVSAASLAKKCRLIVRNLSFQCKNDNLLKVFHMFGDIVECNVPHLPDGKARGFGFVQFKSVQEATKAMEAMNGQKILGRPVAVDWALGKSEYNRLASQEAMQEKDTAEEESEDSMLIDQIDTEIETQEENDDAIIYDSDNEMPDDEPVSKPRETVPDDCTLFVRNLSFDTSRETLKNCFAKWGPLRYAVVTMDRVTQLSRGNGFVAFQNSQDAEMCLAAYDKAASTANMMGVETDIADKDKKSKKSILAPLIPESAPAETEMFTIDGRFISVTPAVSKDIATKISHQSTMNRRANDKRNLYLMREGVIFPDTEAAKQLTPQELEHRVSQFANRKRLLATNPNLFISRTRLSVRGLSPKLTDSQLRKAAKIAVKGFWEDVGNGIREPMEPEVLEEEQIQGLNPPGPERKVWINQSKIIREPDRIDSITKKPKSKGYGFLEFTSHADALACLRYMNNNISAFSQAMGYDEVNGNTTKTKKPVVEFAVENKLVLKRRNERQKSQIDKNDEKVRKRKLDDVNEPNPKKKRIESKEDKKFKDSRDPKNNNFKTHKKGKEVQSTKSEPKAKKPKNTIGPKPGNAAKKSKLKSEKPVEKRDIKSGQVDAKPQIPTPKPSPQVSKKSAITTIDMKSIKTIGKKWFD